MPSPERESPGKPELLDAETRSRLPELYSGEEKGLDALEQVKIVGRISKKSGQP